MTGDAGKSTVRPADGANGAEVAKMIAVAFRLDVPSAEGKIWYEPYMQILKDMGALPYEKPYHLQLNREHGWRSRNSYNIADSTPGVLAIYQHHAFLCQALYLH